jgi:hypothetical protein
MSPTVISGVLIGAGFGVVNLILSRWTSRKAIRLGKKYAVTVMLIGFAARLGLLAAVIFLVPRAWMNPEAFVLTFLVAFMVGLAVETSSWMRTMGRRAEVNDAPGKSIEAESEAEASP